MSDFDVFAPYYDPEFAGFLDDLPVYEGYAGGAGGPLLELACGTGRLLAPLAAAGHRLTGVDIAPAMLARARSRLAAAGLLEQVTLVQDDMRALERLDEARFRLAFCAINSFLHLPDQAAHLAALRAIHRHLDPGGRLVLDVFHPHPDVLHGYDGRLAHEETLVDPVTGDRVDKFVSRTLDTASQTIHTVFIYDRVDAAGLLHRLVAPFALRYIHRYELGLLLDAAGFVLEDLLGDYALNPFGAASLQMIAVARPRV
ncbi:MAG: class I SAM-dependent methyltransferase [Chloroflexi bacterium]|nr:class I SAM-dependent methyltransferase [Chloroflexota bacterium]